MTVYAVDKLMSEARRLAAEYRRITGKTLPLSGELAINDAVRLLGLEPVAEPGLGHDAVRPGGESPCRLQVKARVVFDEIKSSHRVGELRLDRDWDAVLLVLLDADYETYAIYEAGRAAVEAALAEARPNRRGTLTVARFQRIGRLAWSRPLPTAGQAQG
jgi:hypothetical protein